jgi:hypothetical protein
MTENKTQNLNDIGGSPDSMTQTRVVFSEGFSVEKVRENKYVLKSKYGYFEDRTLGGILVVVEAFFGNKYVQLVRQGLGE